MTGICNTVRDAIERISERHIEDFTIWTVRDQGYMFLTHDNGTISISTPTAHLYCDHTLMYVFDGMINVLCYHGDEPSGDFQIPVGEVERITDTGSRMTDLFCAEVA